jgi:hypothetical protein
MTESQSGTSPDALPSGDPGESDALSDKGTAAAEATSVPTKAISAADEASAGNKGSAATEAAGGFRRRGQWLASLAGGAGNAAGSGSGGPRWIQGKSWWAFSGAVAAIIVVATVATAALSGGATTINTSSASQAGRLVPVAGATAATHKAAPRKAATHKAVTRKAASTHPAAPAVTAPAQRPAPPSPPAATTKAPPAATTKAPPATVSMPQPVGLWRMNERTGTIAHDAMGLHPATASNIQWCAQTYGNCASLNGTDSALLNGTDSDFTTSGPVLNTGPGKSFTVSAWFDMTAIPDNGAYETIVSQDGVKYSSFYLQYSGANHRWAFARSVRALSASNPAINTWTHLVGVYDASDSQLRLYVNGVLQGTGTDRSPVAANGDLAIGRAKYNGSPTDWFDGAVGKIEIWNVALTTAQVDKIT